MTDIYLNIEHLVKIEVRDFQEIKSGLFKYKKERKWWFWKQPAGVYDYMDEFICSTPQEFLKMEHDYDTSNLVATDDAILEKPFVQLELSNKEGIINHFETFAEAKDYARTIIMLHPKGSSVFLSSFDQE